MGKPQWEWIEGKLRSLMEHADDLKDIGDSIDDPKFGPWTALKLEILVASVEVYTTIMHSYEYDYYFVDAMAGSGVVDVDDSPEVLVGSPIIAGTVAREPFEKLYFIEADRSRADTLRKRLDYAADNIDAFTQTKDSCMVIHGDANEELPELSDQIEQDHPRSLTGTNGMGGQHHLAFIDNERGEVGFEALRQLESIDGDLLINYQGTGLNRASGHISEFDRSWDNFDAFFDGNRKAREMTSDERLNLYLGLLKDINRGDYRDVFVKASDNYPYGYRMIYATENRDQGGDFLEFMETYSEKIEDFTGDDIQKVLATMRGELARLDGHWTGEETVDDEQFNLDDFA